MVLFYNNIFFHSLIMSAVVILTLLLTHIIEKKYSSQATYISIIVVLIFSILPVRLGALHVGVERSVGQSLIADYSKEVPISQTPVENSSLDIASILSVVWILGVVISLAVRLYKYYRFKQTLQRWATPNMNKDYDHILNDVKKELGIKNDVLDIMYFSQTNTPMLIGIKNARIVLPHQNYDEEEIYFILKHECVHYKRKDTIVRLLSLINMSIHWFNPLMYLFNKYLINQCEKSCDEQVIGNSSKEEKVKYAETIINSIENTMYRKTQMSTQFLGNAKEIKNRLSLIFKERKINKKYIISFVGVFTLGLIVSTSIYAYNKTDYDYVYKKENTNIRNNSNASLMDLDQLKKIALEYSGGGKIVEIEEEYEHGIYSYDFEIINNEYEYSIEVNAVTGELLKAEKESIYD